MKPAARRGATAMLILVGACRSAPGADPSAPVTTVGPSPAETALFCKGKSPKRHHAIEFDADRMPPPKLVRFQPPVLSAEGLRAGAQGELSIKCVITKDGALEDCCILQGVATQNIPVIEAIRNWRYEPYVVGGETINLGFVVKVKIVQ